MSFRSDSLHVFEASDTSVTRVVQEAKYKAQMSVLPASNA